jgi:hypothetical protein
MRKLRAYILGDGKVYILADEIIEKAKGSIPENANVYPEMLCPYKDGGCNSNCAFFNTSWKTGSTIRCGKTKIGVLS